MAYMALSSRELREYHERLHNPWRPHDCDAFERLIKEREVLEGVDKSQSESKTPAIK